MTIFDASLQNLGDYFDATPSKVVVQGDGYYVSGSYGYENGKLRMSTNYGAMVCYGFATKNKINLTGFKYIRFSGIDGNPTSSNSNAFQFDISDEKYISFMNQPPWSRLNTWDGRCGTAIRDRDSSSVSQIVVDISDIVGEWHFVMGSANTVNETGTNTYISKIELLEDITPSGGAGSGYIGNTLVGNKKMVGYNVPTSDAESTKTESVNEASESPVSGKSKIGNGYAKIKLIKEAPIPPSNYIAWLDPEFGVNNLVISKPLQATNVKVVEDYYVADTSSSWSSFIVIPVGMPFTSDIDLIIDLDVYVGNEDNENSTDYGFELYFNLNRNNNRVIGMTMRNSRWASGANINYDIWGNTELHGIYSAFDNTNNNYKWVNLKVVLGFRSGQWVSSKSYIDDTLYQEYTYSGKNMGSNNIDDIETALPANACTYRIKSYKVYTQTPS